MPVGEDKAVDRKIRHIKPRLSLESIDDEVM